MDSLTQFVLGAAVSTVVLGKKLGPRKAALVGGVLGTLPDLDVFIPFDDPVDTFVFHRGWTHSLFVHALATPVIGEGLVRLFKGLRDHRWLTWLAVFLCLSTHALLDAMTIYGTRLLWPVYPEPLGVGSIFIIDPLYTLPLLGVVLWALFKKDWTKRFSRGLTAAVVFSSAYLGFGVAVQSHMENRARDVFAEAGIEPEQMMALAAPFNSVLWKVIGIENGTYHNLYLSLLDDDAPASIYSHPRRPDLTACLEDNEAFEKLAWFSRGYFKAEMIENQIVVSDLRMGMTPAYVFRFAVAEQAGDGAQAISPKREMSHRALSNGDGDWMLARLLGRQAVRAAEAVEGLDAGSTMTCAVEGPAQPAG
ncbi:metal-dependent hydrolase [Roseibium polysiphoniae]|uniref:Metal-dependent hydrolase n=1 Tax=Roseibium polysiphoniae TaxID=2571221 RepID=A0A944GPN5_9HYPH|nr:metal-dependent hydrolase [Roseibium polysiphoniae]MBS8258833.1 metal-dependent hydrolase [Roseibium polysiphoniae]